MKEMMFTIADAGPWRYRSTPILDIDSLTKIENMYDVKVQAGPFSMYVNKDLGWVRPTKVLNGFLAFVQ